MAAPPPRARWLACLALLGAIGCSSGLVEGEGSGAGAAAVHVGGCAAKRLERAENATSGAEFNYGHEEETIQYVTTKFIQPISLAIMTILVLATTLEKVAISWIPESAVIIAVGASLGFGLRGFDLLAFDDLLELNAPAVNMAFLPIIIFESGWSLRSKDFAAQFAYILIFAVLGTFVNMVVVGSLLVWSGNQGWHAIRDTRTAFTFASLIAATDPVATLSTYSALRVEPLLSILVYGESTINDAVAIVVFDIMNSEEVFGPPCTTEGMPVSQLGQNILAGIGKKLFGSIFVGILLAVLYTLVLKFGDMRHAQNFEILFIVSSCYLTFSTAERMHLSGIIAVLFCSIFMGIYSKPHLSEEGKALGSFFIKELATFGDMGIFLLVGVDTVLISSTSLKLSLWVMLFCLIGRAFAVYPCGLLVNSLKKAQAVATLQQEPLMLSGRHLLMMWHAGLRGGIALVLCLEMGEWVDLRNGEGTKQELINVTIVTIIVFLVVFGGSTQRTLQALQIPMGMEVDERYLYDRSLMNWTHRCLHCIHHKLLKPVLYPSEEDKGEELTKDEGGELVGQMIVQATQKHRGQYWFQRKATGLDMGLSSQEEDSEAEVTE